MARMRVGALCLGLVAVSACTVGTVGNGEDASAQGADGDQGQQPGEGSGASPGALGCEDEAGHCLEGSSTPNVELGGAAHGSCAGEAACTGGQACCASGCADLDDDAANCGACERECIYGGGLDQCYAGTCCLTGCKNGLELCDDERFKVPSPAGAMYLVCRNGKGGVVYVATNSGPPTQPGNVERCRGWEENQQDPWDHLDYIATLDCNQAGDKIAVDLSAWEGDHLYVGVHDQPTGGGHNTEVCITVSP